MIPVKFHVLMDESGRGNVSDATILDQIAVLNAAYADNKLAFSLDPVADVLQHVDNELFSTCFTQANKMKTRYGTDVANFMNVYTCEPDFGILGSTTLPGSYPKSHRLHRVVVYAQTLPGGSAKP